MSDTDGGPVFPNHDALGEKTTSESGMSLRDWFAGQALIGMLAKANPETYKEAAVNAYAYADVMLAERAK